MKSYNLHIFLTKTLKEQTPSHNREHAGGRDTDALRVTFAARREQNKTVAGR